MPLQARGTISIVLQEEEATVEAEEFRQAVVVDAPKVVPMSAAVGKSDTDKIGIPALVAIAVAVAEDKRKEEEKKKKKKKDKKGPGNGAGSFVKWLEHIEAPYKNSDFILDSSGKRIAIKPHNANDGYVTVGYGHAIQSGAGAKKYGFNTGGKQAVSSVISSITKQLNNYKSYKDNPAILTFQQAEDLLESDLVKYKTKASGLAKKTGLAFSKNEMDGITSLVYNGNHAYDSDSLLYYFLRKDKNGAINVLHKAVKNGWYGNNEGLLRRRLMEFNIFFNNKYTFYDSTELEKLKKAVGF